MGGGHHAHVRAPQVGTAHATVGAALQQAQQLDLHRQGDVAHLVQKQRAAAGCFHQAGSAGAGAGEGATFMAEQFALEQVLRQAGAVHHHQRPRGPCTGGMHGLGHQFLSGAGLAEQQHAGLRRSDPRHELQHPLEGGRTADQPLRRRMAVRQVQGLHLFDEIHLCACRVAQRHEFDIDISLALGRVVQVQHPFALPRLAGTGQGAGLAGLVARHTEVVGHRITGASDHRALRAELPPVGRVRRDDPVLAVKQDVRLGQTLQIGHQFRQQAGHGSVLQARVHQSTCGPAGCGAGGPGAARR